MNLRFKSIISEENALSPSFIQYKKVIISKYVLLKVKWFRFNSAALGDVACPVGLVQYH